MMKEQHHIRAKSANCNWDIVEESLALHAVQSLFKRTRRLFNESTPVNNTA